MIDWNKEKKFQSILILFRKDSGEVSVSMTLSSQQSFFNAFIFMEKIERKELRLNKVRKMQFVIHSSKAYTN